jgi:hypothetical protein
MKIAVFLDIETRFVPNRNTLRHRYRPVRFEVFTAVTMKNVVFWDVTPYGSCKNRRFGGTYRLHHQGGENQRARRWLKNGVFWDVTPCGSSKSHTA